LLPQQVFAKAIGTEVVREVGKNRASADLRQAKACCRSSSDIDLGIGIRMNAKRKVSPGRELNALCPLSLVFYELEKYTRLLYKNLIFSVMIMPKE
jgi:hypothetical protein